MSHMLVAFLDDVGTALEGIASKFAHECRNVVHHRTESLTSACLNHLEGVVLAIVGETEWSLEHDDVSHFQLLGLCLAFLPLLDVLAAVLSPAIRVLTVRWAEQ